MNYQHPQPNQQDPQEYLQQYTQQFIDAPHADVTLPQPNLQWQLEQPPRYAPVSEEQKYKIYVLPTPPSPGYDESQNIYMQQIDTTADINRLQAAMKEDGCDNRTLISVLTNPKFQDPRALHRLKHDYYSRTKLHLAEQIEQKSQGFFRVALMALLMGPLDYDVYTLQRALSGEKTDERALNDVLLCRSNADIRAIVKKYHSTTGSDLVQLIGSKVDNTLLQLYNPILSGIRDEDAAPAIYAEIYYEVAEIDRLVKGPSTTDFTCVVSTLASANDAQLRAMSSVYKREYQEELSCEIPRRFLDSSMEHAMQRILDFATDRVISDATGLWHVLGQTWDDNIFIYRALRLYRSGIGRLRDVHAAYNNLRTNSTRLMDHLDGALSGDYKELMVALIGNQFVFTSQSK